MILNCLAVGIGGFVGSVLRYLCSFLVTGTTFPWATFVINIVGSFVLAVIAGMVLRGAIPSEELSLMLRVGLCGGFTTFSTFSLETSNLASNGHVGLAALYAVGTCVLCVAAAFAGSWITRA